jgi:hypothetical protein
VDRFRVGIDPKAKGGPMTSQKKCANAACTCVPPNNAKYCSPHCEGIGTRMEIACGCGHPDCGGNLK